MNHCSICSKNIDGTSWLCCKCAKSHKLVGKKYSQWPEWVKACANFEWKERKRERDVKESGYIELSYGTFEDLIEFENKVVVQ